MNLSVSTSGNRLLIRFALAGILTAVLAWLLVKNISAVLDDAYRVQVKATAMSLKRSVLHAREQWFVRGKPVSAQPLSGFGHGNLIMSAHGWPVDALPQGGLKTDPGPGIMDESVRSATRCQRLWHALLQTDTAGSELWSQNQPEAVVNDGGCSYLFTAGGSGRQGAEINYSPLNGQIKYFIR